MNIDKAKKRIAKRIKMGFQGYPQMSLTYFGSTANVANELRVKLILEEGADAQEERFKSKEDARDNESIQTSLLKMIELTGSKTVIQQEAISII